MTKNDTFICPHCGEEIPGDAKACPQCGSDESTGWSEQTYIDGIDLLDSEEYAEIHEREFGRKSGSLPVKKWVVVTGLVLLVIFIAGVIVFTV